MYYRIYYIHNIWYTYDSMIYIYIVYIYYIILYYIISYHIISYYIIVYYILYIILYYIVLYYTILYYILFYYIILIYYGFASRTYFAPAPPQNKNTVGLRRTSKFTWQGSKQMVRCRTACSLLHLLLSILLKLAHAAFLDLLLANVLPQSLEFRRKLPVRIGSCQCDNAAES